MRCAAPRLALLILVIAGVCWCQLSIVREPPSRVVFSNSSGAALPCVAPAAAAVSWLGVDGAPLATLPGLREVLPNGTLWFPAFPAARYRGDVHAGTYRCRAASAAGAVLSRDVHLEAVVDVEWSVRVEMTRGSARAPALAVCDVSAAVRAHVHVTRWLRDGATIPETDPQYQCGGAVHEYMVVSAADEDAGLSCEVRHRLTGELRRAPPTTLRDTVPLVSLSPRMVLPSLAVAAEEGGDVKLVCFAVGDPPPTYSWFRHENGRLVGVVSDVHVSAAGGVLRVRRVLREHAGRWSCRAHNTHAEQRAEISLRVHSPLTVTVTPQLQIADSGSSAQFNCSTEAGARVRWLHDGAPVAAGGERVLRVHRVARVHRGVYQCFAERDYETAQAAAELRLGETAPELQYTFIEQALHPGPPLSLHCSATGSPPPRFTWLLDELPLDQHSNTISVSEFVNGAGEVVSYVNMSRVRTEDGGRYTCRADNSRGRAQHSARLNVYGPPSIRNVGTIKVVAGENATIYCPYSGFPISWIAWYRNGVELGGGGGAGAGAGGAGQLVLGAAEAGDAGLYSCRVTAPSGSHAQRDIQLVVRNPPKIAGFSFPSELVEGMSVQVLCGIVSGDKPVYFSWLKDGKHIPPSLQVQEKSLEEFSFLIFTRLTGAHSGEYTCAASNAAAAHNYTANLAVRVAPSWVVEPQDVSVLVGNRVTIHCQTQGYPEPTVTWYKEQGGSSLEFRPLPVVDINHTVLGNGSLQLTAVAAAAARPPAPARYRCRADNGVGRGIEKVVKVHVHEPVHFEYSSRNVTVEKGSGVSLRCDARGDLPIQIHWTHNHRDIDLTTYRVSVSESVSVGGGGVASQLSLQRAARADAGVYRCRATNVHGHDDMLIYLAVLELPEAPLSLRVVSAWSRGARVAWRRGHDGHAPLRRYRLQASAAAATAPADQDAWAAAPVRDLPAEHVTPRYVGESGAEWWECVVEGLRPATRYAARVAAANDVGLSHYSQPVVFTTTEEVPSEPPQNVEVITDTPGEILVKWKPPPQSSWHGTLLGYVYCWGGGEAAVCGGVRGWGAGAGALVAGGGGDVSVRAFNREGAGAATVVRVEPSSQLPPELPPRDVRCSVTSGALRVRWEPPPDSAPHTLTYEVLYALAGSLECPPELSPPSSGLEAVLRGLEGCPGRAGGAAGAGAGAGGNYSVSVRARRGAGGGTLSDLVYCNAHEDVPGPPADIKVLPASETSLLVSWLAPPRGAGTLTHYNVYYRLQSTGEQSHMKVPASGGGAGGGGGSEGGWVEVRGLRARAAYDVWVCAGGAAGEGGGSVVRAETTAAKAGARAASWGGWVTAAAGTSVRLGCAGAGSPAPRAAWTRARAASPLDRDPRYQLLSHALYIPVAEASLSDNYTCVLRNALGSERVHWSLRVVTSPAPPALAVLDHSVSQAQLQWNGNTQGAAPVTRYVVSYSVYGSDTWHTMATPPSSRTLRLTRLRCGTRYVARVVARSNAGDAISKDVVFSTKGELPKPPLKEELISVNVSCVSLNLLSWASVCPVSLYTAAYRELQQPAWSVRTWRGAGGVAGGAGGAAGGAGGAVCGLRAGAWFHLKVTADTDAGTAHQYYHFATPQNDGEMPLTPAQFPPAELGAAWWGWGWEWGGRAAAAAAALVLAASAAAAAALYRYRLNEVKRLKRAMSVTLGGRGGEKPGAEGGSPRAEPVYTSSPSKGGKDHQDLYEISPYATFSMSGAVGVERESEAGAGCVGAGAGGELRTFRRGREPPRHTCLNNSNREYTMLSLTAAVAADASDSESSDSCQCHYPHTNTPGSSSSKSRPASVSGRAGAGSGRARGEAGGAAGGERRRRPHTATNTPTSGRYSRQEQERRDFTIHV